MVMKDVRGIEAVRNKTRRFSEELMNEEMQEGGRQKVIER